MRVKYGNLEFFPETDEDLQALARHFGESTELAGGAFRLKSKRVFLEERKRALIDFLESQPNGASRQQMKRGVDIPEGSLSALLSGNEFERISRGIWRLKKAGKR